MKRGERESNTPSSPGFKGLSGTLIPSTTNASSTPPPRFSSRSPDRLKLTSTAGLGATGIGVDSSGARGECGKGGVGIRSPGEAEEGGGWEEYLERRLSGRPLGRGLLLRRGEREESWRKKKGRKRGAIWWKLRVGTIHVGGREGREEREREGGFG